MFNEYIFINSSLRTLVGKTLSKIETTNLSQWHIIMWCFFFFCAKLKLIKGHYMICKGRIQTSLWVVLPLWMQGRSSRSLVAQTRRNLVNRDDNAQTNLSTPEPHFLNWILSFFFLATNNSSATQPNVCGLHGSLVTGSGSLALCPSIRPSVCLSVYLTAFPLYLLVVVATADKYGSIICVWICVERLKYPLLISPGLECVNT